VNILRRLFGRRPKKHQDFTAAELSMFRRFEPDPEFRRILDMMIEEKREEEKK